MGKLIMGALATTALLLSSTVAASSTERGPSKVGEHEEIAGNPWIPWLVALAALVAIVIVVTDDEDEPTSP